MGLSLFTSAVMATLLGIVILWRTFSFRVSIGLGTLRILPPLLYFGVFFTGGWTFLDDIGYLTDAIQLKYEGFGPISILTDPYGIERMETLAGGYHILYTWWNLLAVSLFGDYYYSAVFLNVMLSYVCSHYMGRTVRDLGYSEPYARGLHVFTLFHWDILAWSSLVNLKDTLVMTLTLIAIHSIVSLDRRPRFLQVVQLALSIVLLLRVRFYVPALMSISMVAWSVTFARRRLFLSSAIVLAGLLLLVVGALQVSFHSEDYVITTDDIIYNVINFLLTPIPWNIDPAYSFLILPSILHWLLLVPVVISAVRIWKESRAFRLMLFYAILIILFYAMIPDLRGPRHRLQIAFVFAWLQYDFLYRLLTVKPRIAEADLRTRLEATPSGQVASC